MNLIQAKKNLDKRKNTTENFVVFSGIFISDIFLFTVTINSIKLVSEQHLIP